MTHGDFARTYGADPASVDKIKQFARENNLQVLERGDEVLRRTVTMAGTAADMEKAFSIELVGFEHPDGTYRSHTGPVQVPEAYAPLIQAVFGLDNRPVAHPHLRFRNTNRTFGTRTATTTYTPVQVASLYDFPRDADGNGQTIGIIELGGGFRPADLHQYFLSLNLKNPPVRAVLVNDANNRPTTPNSADAEVMLDIEIAGAVANGASMAIYFTPIRHAVSRMPSAPRCTTKSIPHPSSPSAGAIPKRPGPSNPWNASTRWPRKQLCWASPSWRRPATRALPTVSPARRPT